MKLITERIEKVGVITEKDESTGKKNYFIQGVFLQGAIKNKNGRVYPIEILDKEVSRYIKEKIETNRALGELEHPENPSINLDRVSHKIISLVKEGNNYIGKAKILDTNCGQIVKSLLEEGVSLGVSSRGMGSLKQVEVDLAEVQDDFYLATAADIVAEPSAPDAFINGILEGKEWVKVDNNLIEKAYADAKKVIKSTPIAKTKTMAIDEFQKFLKIISKV